MAGVPTWARILFPITNLVGGGSKKDDKNRDGKKNEGRTGKVDSYKRGGKVKLHRSSKKRKAGRKGSGRA
jgi:hypothetical protein